MRDSVYFVSDMHFGAPSYAASLVRERAFVAWLTAIAPTAKAIYLVGDLFDFWFEYQYVVPRGYVRMLGKLAELADSGIELHVFPGNHDLWYRTYFSEEIGATVHTRPLLTEMFGQRCYLAHGDGLGPGDHGYKAMKRVFTNRVAEWAFQHLLHPDFAARIAARASRSSGDYTRATPPTFFAEDEFLTIHSREMLRQSPDIQHFIYGHRHIATQYALSETATMTYLGDWISLFSYARLTAQGMELCRFGGK
jgi:UDP-2,3-diacylglucosamine hydrolase